MTSTATMNTADASTSTDSPPSTLDQNSLLQFQSEIAFEGVNETPPEEKSQIDNGAAIANSTIQTLYQCTQQDPHDSDDLTPLPVLLANPHGHVMTITPPQEQHVPALQVCQICGESDSPTRRLCCFLPNGYTTHTNVIHVFCGKTAAILPKINRPDLEILHKSGIKKKFGIGPILTLAMRRARSAVVDGKIYFLTREVQEHISQLAHQHTMSPSTRLELLPSSYSPELTAPCGTSTTTTSTTTTPTPNYTNPRPPPEMMEALKKITPPPPPRKKLKKTKSPYELLMERLQCTSNAIGGIGYSLVRGVSPAMDQDDHGEQDDENFNPNLCSQAQVDHVRIMIVTQDRQEQLSSMARHFQEMSETSELASHVWDTWRLFQCKYRNLKCWKAKLNMLLGFTDAVKDNDEWMVSTAYPWNDFTTGLGRLWKVLLKKSPEELGVDVEFTLPGIMCLLQDFQEQVKSVETTAMQFQYQVGTKS